VRTALIGLGRIGWNYHMKQILSHEGFDLCAVVDTSNERLEEAKSRYGVEGFADYKQMLLQAKPELVVIASPTVFHEEQAVAAMLSGADVLLDKPMAMNYEEACRIAQVQKQTGRKLVIYQPHRFSSIAVAMKAVMASGKLGEIFAIRACRYGYSRRDDWQAFRKFGGGMLCNYGAHYIDQMLYLSQSEIVDFQCRTQKILSLGDAEDVVHILMKTKSGLVLDIDINQATPNPDSTAIFGSLGSASIFTEEDGKQYFLLKYCDPAEMEEKKVSDNLAAANRKYPSEKIVWHTETMPLDDYPEKDFYAACQTYFLEDGPTPVPLEQTLRVMELIDEGYRQNKQ